MRLSGKCHKKQARSVIDDRKKTTIKVKELNPQDYIIPNVAKLYGILTSPDSYVFDTLSLHVCDEGDYMFCIKFKGVCFIGA